ncbi:unnamed protein product [Triticum turgidum subsp. durum]|uniref:RING-type domain-containing protein n=1 Tax=Triticum turgidum subsp. durum TaxID=4567 RepID=A0A9R0V827_TRITD|nr:unnamed protein product [Triticum turgidum subsp. durum]
MGFSFLLFSTVFQCICLCLNFTFIHIWKFQLMIVLFCFCSRFERERTCPLCRALVKPADIRSFGDGSTSLFFQLF